MYDKKHEQRIGVKFLVKLKETPTEYYKSLKEANGENSLSRVHVFEWYKWFSAKKVPVMTNVQVSLFLF